jgi:hypothetical protein
MFFNFCKIFSFDGHDPSRLSVFLFLEWLAQKVKVSGTVLNHFSALKFYFKLCKVNVKVYASFELDLLLKGIKATLPSRLTLPSLVSPLLLRQLVLLTKKMGLAHHTFALALLLGYFGLLRASNYLVYSTNAFKPSKNLIYSDISVNQGRLVVKLKSTKTRKKQENIFVVLPVMKEKIMSPVFHFRALCKEFSYHKRACCPLLLLPDSEPLTIHIFNRVFKGLMHEILGTSLGFSSHTLRRSGATYLFLAGATDLQLQKQGTWVSDCFKKYILSSKSHPSPVQAATDKFF